MGLETGRSLELGLATYCGRGELWTSDARKNIERRRPRHNLRNVIGCMVAFVIWTENGNVNWKMMISGVECKEMRYKGPYFYSVMAVCFPVFSSIKKVNYTSFLKSWSSKATHKYNYTKPYYPQIATNLSTWLLALQLTQKHLLYISYRKRFRAPYLDNNLIPISMLAPSMPFPRLTWGSPVVYMYLYVLFSFFFPRMTVDFLWTPPL